MPSELLSRTCHELRTPLNAILGFAQLLEMSDLSETDHGNVGYILQAGRDLLKLLNEVLDISDIETGRRTLALERVYVRDAVAESVDLVRSRAAAREIVIHDSVETDHWVLADRQRLQQVLINLLLNAVNYNRPAGEIFVFCQPQTEGLLRVSVRDTGPGIAPGNLERIFTPFDRLGAEQTEVQGIGLGLSFAKAFMHAIGGGIGFESFPGSGATFWIDIPPSRVAASHVPLRSVLSIAGAETNRDLSERTQMIRSIALLTAQTGSAGIAAARDTRPDAVLFDLDLADIHRDEIIRALKLERIPVILLGADEAPSQIQNFLSLGADAYLGKPVNMPRLLQALNNACAERTAAC